jgi:hypothetical protein
MLQNTNFTSIFAPSGFCVPYTRRRKCRRRYWSGSVRTPMRIRISCCCCCSFVEIEVEVFVVLFESMHRPNFRFMEANMQRKKMDMKHKSMKRFRFGFGDFIATIVLLLNGEIQKWQKKKKKKKKEKECELWSACKCEW